MSNQIDPGCNARKEKHNVMRTNHVNFACAIDVPGRPMSAAKVETSLAPVPRGMKWQAISCRFARFRG